MKRKVSRKRAASSLEQKLLGVHVFRVSGPCAITGARVIREFTGTREQAKVVTLFADHEVIKIWREANEVPCG